MVAVASALRCWVCWSCSKACSSRPSALRWWTQAHLLTSCRQSRAPPLSWCSCQVCVCVCVRAAKHLQLSCTPPIKPFVTGLQTLQSNHITETSEPCVVCNHVPTGPPDYGAGRLLNPRKRAAAARAQPPPPMAPPGIQGDAADAAAAAMQQQLAVQGGEDPDAWLEVGGEVASMAAHGHRSWYSKSS